MRSRCADPTSRTRCKQAYLMDPGNIGEDVGLEG